MTEETLMDAAPTMHEGETTHVVFGVAVQGL
jgi:hypothetical protein